MKILAAERLLAETLDQYLQRLADLKIKKLGTGAFSDVFQHPTMPNVAVKLVPFTDHGYEAYLKFCQRHQNNPYCPKILDVRRKARGFDSKYSGVEPIEYTLIFMEKLKPITARAYDKFGTFVRKQLGDEAEYWRSSTNVTGMLSSSDVWVDVAASTADAHLRQLAQFLGDPPEPLDLHRNNLMLRGTQVVVTDPLS